MGGVRGEEEESGRSEMRRGGKWEGMEGKKESCWGI